jgi:imidazolonepropionase-like amidohydrolase
VLELWAHSRVGYTPTLLVTYGAIQAENYWYEKTNVWENDKLLQFTPPQLIDSRSRHRNMIPEKEYENGFMLVSKTCKQLSDSGVVVNLGAHGQLQGLGAHWELWSLQLGGMSNLEALKAATINGADYIGLASQIGSIEKGKLADMIILDENPLDDIRNSLSIRFTMINGRLYHAGSMKTADTAAAPVPPLFYWQIPGAGMLPEWSDNLENLFQGACGCHSGH